MGLLQDAVNDIRPTKEQAEKEIKHLTQLIPDREFTVCNGYVGSWVMLQNGSTCFHCPPF